MPPCKLHRYIFPGDVRPQSTRVPKSYPSSHTPEECTNLSKSPTVTGVPLIRPCKHAHAVYKEKGNTVLLCESTAVSITGTFNGHIKKGLVSAHHR